MKYMSHNDIRNTWFKFFTNKKHKIYESASLIPVNDDSLLWINAGVAPLKKYFDGREIPESRRITNIQKCIYKHFPFHQVKYHLHHLIVLF